MGIDGGGVLRMSVIVVSEMPTASSELQLVVIAQSRDSPHHFFQCSESRIICLCEITGYSETDIYVAMTSSRWCIDPVFRGIRFIDYHQRSKSTKFPRFQGFLLLHNTAAVTHLLYTHNWLLRVLSTVLLHDCKFNPIL